MYRFQALILQSSIQADFIRNGSIQKVMGLSASDQAKLWAAIDSNDYETYTLILDQLLFAGATSADSATTPDSLLKALPIRLYNGSAGDIIRRLFKPQGSLLVS